MATCQAVTSAGRPCPCKARIGFNTCGRHKNTVVQVVDLTICGQQKTNGGRCSKKCVEGDTLCKLHRTVLERREQEQRARFVWAQAMEIIWGQGLITEFAQVRGIVDTAFDNGWLNQGTYDGILFQLHTEWVWYRRERIAPTVNATTDLQRLALDNQNVHTKEINKQTSDAQEYLLKTEVPDEQDTLREIAIVWSDKVNNKRVMRDLKNWYETSTCVKKDDWLYACMLDGLWVRIKEHKEIDELVERLWEEVSESVGMCCQGHLSRLGNVLVGFTEEVKAEVPIGEILQQKIASIAEKDIGVEYKVCEAWTVFEELKIPVEERDAWIEAF